MKQLYKSALVEIIALNIFSYVTAAPVELFIAGMSVEQHLGVRLISLITNTIIARPFGAYREQLIQKFRVPKHNLKAKYMLDTLATLTFQTPIYVGVTILVGCSFESVIISAAILTALAISLGRVYCTFLDFCRRITHLKIAYGGDRYDY